MRKAKPIVHGTISAYTYYKCRCDECRDAMSEWKREYRQNGGSEVESAYRVRRLADSRLAYESAAWDRERIARRRFGESVWPEPSPFWKLVEF